MLGVSPDSLLHQLGRVHYQDEEEPLPGAGLSADSPGTGVSNYDFTPRPWVNGKYQNVLWPSALQVDPINDNSQWRRQERFSEYANGLYWTQSYYNEDGEIEAIFCSTCTAGWMMP
jgi:hypothetical protein